MSSRTSTHAGKPGAVDDDLNVRGYTLKFNIKEGHWDLFGNNTPVSSYMAHTISRIPPYTESLPSYQLAV